MAAEHASFGLPEARLGLIPGAGGLFRLARQLDAIEGPRAFAEGAARCGAGSSQRW